MKVGFKKIKIGITMGDPSGIGAEIISKALASPRIKNIKGILVIGDRWVFEKNQKSKIKNQKFEFLDLKNVPKENFRFGVISPVYGRVSLEYIDKAIELIKEDKIQALVTNPVSKEAINLAGVKFSGHTEYIAKSFGIKDFAMMLVGGDLKIVIVTRHIPLRKVSKALSISKIYKTILLTKESLETLFGIEEPKIVVASLNPHCGEGGFLGEEEKKKIIPAISLAKRYVKNLYGPFPSDTLFYSALKKEYDCVICMYHDQGLIPLKMLFRDKAVNITLGLNFLRTSPAHGVAFDIAGKNKANPDSLIEAIKLAYECSIKIG